MSFVEDRLRAMQFRILSSIEHMLKCDLDAIEESEIFNLKGEDLKLLRSVVLDATNDTIRSLPKDGNLTAPDAKLRFPRNMFPVFKHAELDFLPSEDIPYIIFRGEEKFVREIRHKIQAGIVYNDDSFMCCACVGVDDVVNRVIPYLDMARMARITVGNGDYDDWRDRVVNIYLGEDDENE